MAGASVAATALCRPWAGRMGKWRQPMDRHEKSPSAQSHPLKRSSQEHFSVDLIRASVARGGKYSPASRLCQYRVLRPVFSAICSCVIPAPTRIAETFRPKRVRSRQGTGFFDGIPGIVAKTKRRQHEALPRYIDRCILAEPQRNPWQQEKTEDGDSCSTRNPIEILPRHVPP